MRVIATPSRQLGYPVLHPNELQSTARLCVSLCAVSYILLWQKHQDRIKHCQSELDRTGAGLQILRFFPILLSKLVTSVLSFTSFSNFMTWAQHANECCTVEENLTRGLLAVSRHSSAFATLSPSQLSRHRSLIHNVRNNWIGIMWLFLLKTITFHWETESWLKSPDSFSPIASSHTSHRKKSLAHETKARLPHK